MLVVAGVLMMPLAGSPAEGQPSLTEPPTNDEVAALIRDLGDPSYKKRTYATQRLCAIGMPASKRLEAAAAGGDVETALRAKAILSVLNRLMFSGVDVILSFSKTKLAWNDAVDLRITMVNRTMYPARVPFEIDTAQRTTASDDARQVGDMLDVAELLHVRGPGGKELDLTVDDIAADPAVVAAVQERLNSGPSSILKPGEQVAVTARAFNRGWARYRLLDAGAYSVVMEYEPNWDDDVLAAKRVGRMISNQAKITVTKSAPETISRAGAQASLALERDGAFIIARLTNRTDQPMFVNKNFGGSPPFAKGKWVYELDGSRREVPVERRSGVSWDDFDATMLVEVNAGQSVELARIGIGDVRRAFARAGAKLDDSRWTLHFSYVNLCDLQWQTRQGSALLGNTKAPPIFQSPLPRRILSARHSSNRLTAPDAR